MIIAENNPVEKMIMGKNNLSRETISEHRVIHNPEQVKCLDDLQVGNSYIPVHIDDGGQHKKGTRKYRLLSFDKKRHAAKVSNEPLAGEPSKPVPRITIFLADFGVVPYEIGKWKRWNIVNYLIPDRT